MIKPGDAFPEATLAESTEFGEACPLAPKPVKTSDALKDKRVVIFGLPGAFTPTCSAKHVPGYLAQLDKLRGKGIDEVWCIATNDAFVMASWGKGQGAIGKIRMLGDGSAELTKKLGLEMDIPGMGTRMKRCSLLVDNGVVKQVNVEAPGKFEVSSADYMLEKL